MLFILLLKSFQLWPLGGLLGRPLGNFEHIPTLWFCKIMPPLCCIFLIQVLKSVISPRSPWKMVFRNQYLGTGYAHCYWDVTDPRSSDNQP